jgi:hypothetical protein
MHLQINIHSKHRNHATICILFESTSTSLFQLIYSIHIYLFLQKVYIDNGLGNMNKIKFNIKEVRYKRSKFMRKSYVARKIESRRVQTVRMIGLVGCLGHP